MTSATEHAATIGASRVIGTAVKDLGGEKIGTVADVVLDKTSDSVAFAVVGFGGFLGVGEQYHAVPWSALKYEIGQDAYVIPQSREQLQRAPVASLEELTRTDGRDYRDRAYEYYGIAPYW